jgi:hypothetical protein
MTATDLHDIADAVVRRAKDQGSVLPEEVREELTRAGQPDTLWQDVLALARPALRYRDGRYHYVATLSARAREEQQHQRRIRAAVERLIARHQAGAAAVERREEDRVDFVQPVRVRTEDGREFTLLSRDLSAAGIRLVGTRRLLGQKVHVRIPAPEEPAAGPPQCFVVRILWTCAVGEDLFENGGMFLDAPAEE